MSSYLSRTYLCVKTQRWQSGEAVHLDMSYLNNNHSSSLLLLQCGDAAKFLGSTTAVVDTKWMYAVPCYLQQECHNIC